MMLQIAVPPKILQNLPELFVRSDFSWLQELLPQVGKISCEGCLAMPMESNSVEGSLKSLVFTNEIRRDGMDFRGYPSKIQSRIGLSSSDGGLYSDRLI